MQIAVNLPNDFVSFQSVADIEKDMRLSYSLWLFKNARVRYRKRPNLQAWIFMSLWQPVNKMMFPSLL
ncbi:MAG: hypothetical protein Q7U66_14880 [Methylobacter sp.]|nr:hypothetical protein [Methylobacter sp.]